MNHKTNILVIIIGVLWCFVSCKKYPENDLWFKNPEKISIINGKITEYKVNDFDSLPYLNVYYKPYIPNSIYPYNKTDRNVSTEEFSSIYLTKSNWEIDCDLYESLTCVLQNDKKTVRIGGQIDTVYYRKQLFLDTKGDLDWEILYLDGKGKSKIKTTFQGNTYEITFEK